MNRFLLVVLSLSVFLLLFTCCAFEVTIPPPKVAVESASEYAYRSTAKLQVESIAGGNTISASGFALDEERVMTAAHFCVGVVEKRAEGLLRDTMEAICVNDDNELTLVSDFQIETIDEKMDICVVRRKGHGIKPLPLVEDYDDDVKIHESVIVVGAPLGFFPTTSVGRVIHTTSSDVPVAYLNNRMIVHAPGTFGNSGGPVVNSKGEVVGIIIAKVNRFHHILFAATAKQIKEYLAREY